jgi:hypothetical protein
MKKKINFIKLISIILIACGIAYGGVVLTIYLVKKQQSSVVSIKSVKSAPKSLPKSKTLESIEPSFAPIKPQIEEIKNVVLSTFNQLAPPISTFGGIILLFLNIRKAKREDEKLRAQVIAAEVAVEKPPVHKKSPTQYPKKKKSPTKTGLK